jgi:hypothetical protein
MLVNQPTAAPSRKWKYGALVSAVLGAAAYAAQIYYPEEFATWSPIAYQIAGALGFAIPAYVVRNEKV